MNLLLRHMIWGRSPNYPVCSLTDTRQLPFVLSHSIDRRSYSLHALLRCLGTIKMKVVSFVLLGFYSATCSSTTAFWSRSSKTYCTCVLCTLLLDNVIRPHARIYQWIKKLKACLARIQNQRHRKRLPCFLFFGLGFKTYLAVFSRGITWASSVYSCEPRMHSMTEKGVHDRPTCRCHRHDWLCMAS